MRKVALAMVALLAVAVLPTAGSAAPGRDGGPFRSDVRELDMRARRDLVVTPQDVREARASLGAGTATPAVGEDRVWLAVDDVEAVIYPKLYQLRGVGEHIEVWIANDEDDVSTGTEFPPGDCRNDGIRNEITDEQVQYLIDEFDSNIYPIESEAFSVPPSRNGRRAPLTEILELPANYYRGDGDRIVVLIDNVRDGNFYDTDNERGFTYTAGFYSSLYDDVFNRLVMTIDAWDWIHRTGPNPPNAPSSDNCTNAPARPFLYEGVFAHEYQHLLENYVDFDESAWVNEGLSDYAATITGYFDPAAPVTDVHFLSSLQCLLGWYAVETPVNPIPGEGGPENSLTMWGDQTDFQAEILCDYGAAHSIMEYLAGRFGPELLKALHRDRKNGLDSLAAQLAAAGGGKPLAVIRSWAAMLAVDASIDAGWTLQGGDADQFSTPTLNASINWDNDQAYAGPGVPPNGSDYVRLRNESGAYLSVGEVEGVSFNGATELPKLPVEWRVDGSPPSGSSKALYSGRGDNLDRAIARPVRVGNGTLELDAAWETEEGYDYAYVQVSDDGGETYRSVRCTDSIDAPLGPGFEGNSRGFRDQRCNLSRWSGKRILLAFRYVTDSSVVFDGFWVDDAVLDGRTVASGATLRGWKSPSQVNPVDVQAFAVRLVAFDEAARIVRMATLPLDRDLDGSISGQELDALIGTAGSTVAAIVTYLDRTEEVFQTAPYTLKVNGVKQPGG